MRSLPPKTLRRCPGCGSYQHPYAMDCPKCGHRIYTNDEAMKKRKFIERVGE